MSESSGSTSVSFQRDEKRKKSVVFGLDSDASSSVDRDKLMDQYEAKMGELLRCQKEICELKNQNAILQQKSRDSEKIFRSSMQDYEQQITELQEKYNSAINLTKQSSIPDGSPNVSKWIQKCHDLEETIKEKDRIISRKDAELEEYNESSASLNSERIEFVEKCNKQQQEINNLKLSLKEMETMKTRIAELEKNNKELVNENNALHENIIDMQKKVNVKVNESSAIKETMNEKEDMVNTLAAKLKEMHDSYQASEQELLTTKKALKLQKAALKSREQDNQQLRIDNKKLGEIGKKLQEKVIHLDNKLKTIFEAAPDIDSVDELVEYIKQIPKDQKATRKVLRDMRKENSKLLERAEQADALSAQNAELKEHATKLLKIRLICKSFSNINHEMTSKLNEYVGIKTPSLRNIIVMTVLLRRWNRSIHDAEWGDGTLNWWWMAPCGNNRVLDGVSEIVKNYNELIDENKELSDEIKHLNEDAKNVNYNEEKIESDKYARKLLLKQIEELNEEISSMVSKEEYESKATALHEKKQELKKALAKISEMQKEIYSNEEEIGALKLEKQENDDLMNEMRKCLSDAKEEIEELNGQIKLMQKFNSSKRKEILSLERGVIKNESEKLKSNLEMQALVTENAQLYHQMHHTLRYVNRQDKSNIIRTLL